MLLELETDGENAAVCMEATAFSQNAPPPVYAIMDESLNHFLIGWNRPRPAVLACSGASRAMPPMNVRQCALQQLLGVGAIRLNGRRHPCWRGARHVATVQLHARIRGGTFKKLNVTDMVTLPAAEVRMPSHTLPADVTLDYQRTCSDVGTGGHA